MLPVGARQSEDLYFYVALTVLALIGFWGALHIDSYSGGGMGNPIGILESPNGVRRHATSLSWADVDENTPLYVHDVIYAPPGVTLSLMMKDRSRLQLDPETLIELEEPLSGGNSFHLLQGQAVRKGTSGEVKTEPGGEEDNWGREIDQILKKVGTPVIPLSSVDSLDETYLSLLARTRLALGTYPELAAIHPVTQFVPLRTVEDAPVVKMAPPMIDYHFRLEKPVSGEVFPEGYVTFSWAPLAKKGVLYFVEVSRDPAFGRSIFYRTTENHIKIGFTNTATFEATEASAYYWRVRAVRKDQKVVSESRQVLFSHGSRQWKVDLPDEPEGAQ
jgi:hypothetical protein